MNEEMKRYTQEQAAKMMGAAGEQPFRYVHGIGKVVAQALKENPGAVDARVSVAKRDDGKIVTLIQAYDANDKPVGDPIEGRGPCPPCCPKCPGD